MYSNNYNKFAPKLEKDLSRFSNSMKCTICLKNTLDPKVQVIYHGKIVADFPTAMKAQDYAIDHLRTPCILRYVYECSNCKKFDVKNSRVYDGI